MITWKVNTKFNNHTNNRSPLLGLQLKIINDPPLFSGSTKDLDGFLTRVELAIEVNPHRFPDDRRRVMFVISYLYNDDTGWVGTLIYSKQKKNK